MSDGSREAFVEAEWSRYWSALGESRQRELAGLLWDRIARLRKAVR